MIAHHPITGKEVRIIQTEASMWKENKTLLYARESLYHDTVYHEGASDYLIQIPYTGSPTKTYRLILASQVKGGGSVLALEELHRLYPHLGDPWDGTMEDAVVMLAALMRYRRVNVTNARSAKLGLLDPVKPLKLWWITQYYDAGSRARQKELKKCLDTNVASPLIDKVILLNETSLGLASEKIEERVIGHRLTYADVIRSASEFPDVLVAFANADICIDTVSWRQLWDVNMENKFLALLRYDVPASGQADATIFGPRADSQDTWVVRSADLHSKAGIADDLDFQFGRMGCDNAIALEMLRKRFVVVNPSLSLKTWHYHESGVRNYVRTDIIEKPIFHYVWPSGFHDLNPNYVLEGNSYIPESYSRVLSGGAATKWISVVNKNLKTPLKILNENRLVPSKETVIHVRNCFQTPDGLAFDNERLFIGKSVRGHELWGKSQISPLTASLECKRGLIAPYEGSTRESYVLRYLSKILQLGGGAANIGAEGWEFFCPDRKDVVEAMEAFTWNSPSLPVLKHDPDAIIWCRDARIMTVSDNVSTLVEDIAALRASVRRPAAQAQADSSKKPRLVIVEDDDMTDERVRLLEQEFDLSHDVRVVYGNRTSIHRMVEVMTDAWGVVCGPRGYSWNWLLPSGAFVFEMLAGKPGVEALELSSAAGLDHRLCLSSEEIASVQRSAEADAEADDKPIVWMPVQQEGYFGHPGDSFREMARLWEEAGLCQIKEHAGTMVWWGSVGAKGVLLYDRPNHDWRLAAPMAEREWAAALFGNPKPIAGITSPWFFWPRRPSLVEKFEPRHGFHQRKGTVFYGKIENKVQERRRQGSWKEACEEWIMVRGDEKYPFTQGEYLFKLSEARFGLCLAGYGLKCHREVECMAVGTVPLCSSDVDMDSYASPPVEGIHYIRVNGPDDIRKAESMGEDQWIRMSAACRKWWSENASCAGSFQLTKRLIDGFNEVKS